MPVFSLILLALISMGPVMSSRADDHGILPEDGKGSATAASELPTKASQDDIELLDASTRTNRLSDLSRQPAAEKFQVMLEAGRRLRESKELKRAESGLIALLESRAPEEIKRAALIELGLTMQDQHEYSKAQRIYSEYTRRYAKDPKVPEVLLRQGYLYREMGVSVLALSKFYAVISSCLNLQLDQLEYYQKLVLRAQAEIAETYFLDGKYAEAADYLNRLLRLDASELARADVLYKMLRCHCALGQHGEAIGTARLYLEKYADRFEAPEARFLLASSLKKLGRTEEALQEIGELLKVQHASSVSDPKQWLYWQQRAGNEIANELYRESDFLNALKIYESLAELNRSADWQVPVWYQIGLVYENLKQSQKAAEMYEKIIAREKEAAGATPSPALKQVAEMAAWRKQSLAWENQAKLVNQELQAQRPKEDTL